jgi:lysophospholipase L1-like esterase
MNHHRVAVFGHSFIHRARMMSQQNLGLRDCDVHFVSRGGGSIILSQDVHSLYRLVQQVASLRPHIVFIHAGENDLYLPPPEVVDQLQRLIEYIEARCRPSVILIGQLVLFPRQEHLREQLGWINTQMQEYVRRRNARHSRTRLVFWQHRMGIFGPDRLQLFSSDRVHLNSEGIRRYLSSLRAAIGQIVHT